MKIDIDDEDGSLGCCFFNDWSCDVDLGTRHCGVYLMNRLTRRILFVTVAILGFLSGTGFSPGEFIGDLSVAICCGWVLGENLFYLLYGE